MSCPGLQVDNSPFRPDQIELLGRLLPTLTPDQGVWLSGYLAGVQATAAPETQATAALSEGAAAAATEATVLYGSQTGNAKRLAEDLARRLQECHVAVTLSCMSELKPANLKKVKNLFVLVSTHGEGDPPDKAKLFHEFLHGKRAPRLEGLRYAVLGLGDLSYKRSARWERISTAAWRNSARSGSIRGSIATSISTRPSPLGPTACWPRWAMGPAPAVRRPPLPPPAAAGKVGQSRCRRRKLLAEPAVSGRSPGEPEPQRPRLGQGNPPPEAPLEGSGL